MYLRFWLVETPGVGWRSKGKKVSTFKSSAVQGGKRCNIIGHVDMCMAYLGTVQAHDGHIVEIKLGFLVTGSNNIHTAAAHEHKRGVSIL